MPTILTTIVNDFFTHEFRGHDIARRVESECIVHNCNEFRMSGEAPINCDGIAPFLPLHWTCHISPFSDVSNENTGTRKVLWVSIPIEPTAHHPLYTELVAFIALALFSLALLATLVYRYLYIY